MQVFTPYSSPFETAKAMINDKARYNKQIIECQQILDAISGKSKAWCNHPVVKMYTGHELWLNAYMRCLECYKKNDLDGVFCNNKIADIHTPDFLTPDFCDQHKRRLYTKAPDKYPQFAEYGLSEENWYYVDGQLKKYINGKQIQ